MHLGGVLMNKEVPLSLVKTWVALARSDNTEYRVKKRVLLMLREKIGKPEQIACYMKKNNIT